MRTEYQRIVATFAATVITQAQLDLINSTAATINRDPFEFLLYCLRRLHYTCGSLKAAPQSGVHAAANGAAVLVGFVKPVFDARCTERMLAQENADFCRWKHIRETLGANAALRAARVKASPYCLGGARSILLEQPAHLISSHRPDIAVVKRYPVQVRRDHLQHYARKRCGRCS